MRLICDCNGNWNLKWKCLTLNGWFAMIFSPRGWILTVVSPRPFLLWPLEGQVFYCPTFLQKWLMLWILAQKMCIKIYLKKWKASLIVIVIELMAFWWWKQAIWAGNLKYLSQNYPNNDPICRIHFLFPKKGLFRLWKGLLMLYWCAIIRRPIFPLSIISVILA